MSAPLDPVASARAAHCRYVDHEGPGIRRVRAGRGFRYVGPRGRPVRDPDTLRRIRSLAVPPAWRDVWICASADGHIQATGRDARGRKQYRYHPRFREIREETKYERLVAFAAALPTIRKRVDQHLDLPGLPREKVLATVVRLLEITLIRVGNEEYARDNGSFGLTTLRARHVDVHGSEIVFRFRGKSGKEHAVRVEDRRVARIVHRCHDLPGQELFQYVDQDDARRSIEASDVNEYLKTVSGDEFTAKHFRTWAGTVLTACALEPRALSGSLTKKAVVDAVKEVSARLGNTPAVCRRCYVHPEVIDAFHAGRLHRARLRRPAGRGGGLSSDEAWVLALLEDRPTIEQAFAASLKPRRAA